jgi:glucose-6-phosphate isomerase
MTISSTFPKKSWQELEKLAKTPFDLTAINALSLERIQDMTAENGSFKLLYATERVSEQEIRALKELALETNALTWMQKMQNGEVVNLGENRPAHHTALRDGSLPAQSEFNKLEKFIQIAHKEFDHLIHVGIGGSDLGPQAFYQALKMHQLKGKSIHFVSNIDPDAVAHVLHELPLERTLLAVVSKSGGTLETKINAEILSEAFRKKGLDPRKHSIAITTEKSALDDRKQFREVFYFWDWVGGRYSVTSCVGGVPLSFIFGIKIFKEILEGAHAMDLAALEPSLEKNLPLLSALLGIWNRNFLKTETLALIPYAESLLRFPAHIQQLDMESNGKRVDREGNPCSIKTGPVIWGEPGTNAQHSFFQLLHQGTDIIPLLFIAFKEAQRGINPLLEGTTSHEKLNSNLIAQAIALATGQEQENPDKQFPGNRPSHILVGQKLTPSTLGALLSFFENRTAFQGFIWNINSFNQEGVELGKKLAEKCMGCFKAKRENKPSNYPLGEAFIKQIYD